ncbi:MAG: thiamine pyrophosphate-dependent enzyme, partial [Alphaproteobacteria bacterium]|nr:thiamine pyrophosphate-dependent enzyme [Alphaproteobacteria bacterium]
MAGKTKMHKAQPHKQSSASSKQGAATQKPRTKTQKRKAAKKMSNSILPNDELLSQNKASQNKASQNKASQNKASQNKASQNKARKASKAPQKMSNSILPNDELLSAYRDMLLIRRFEERAGQLYGLGKIGGFCHLYSGQEAVITGVVKARRADDQIITAYRDHGHIIACGIEPKFVMAELLGRVTGSSKGKGGSIHMFAVAQHFYGGHGI